MLVAWIKTNTTHIALRQHMCKATHSNGKMSYRLCRSSALWCRLTCGALLNNSLTVCEHSPNDESFTSAVGRCPFPLAIYGEGGGATGRGGGQGHNPPTTRLSTPIINIVIIFKVHIIFAILRLMQRICSVIVV